MSATQLADCWTNAEGATVKVPPNAKAALEARGEVPRAVESRRESAVRAWVFQRESIPQGHGTQVWRYSAAQSVESDGKGKRGDRALAKSRPKQEMDVRIRRYSFHAAPRARFEVREDCPDDGKLALCAKMGKSGAAQKLKEGYDEAAV